MDFNKIEVCSIDDHGIWCMNEELTIMKLQKLNNQRRNAKKRKEIEGNEKWRGRERREREGSENEEGLVAIM